MDLRLPLLAPLEAYQAQATQLLAGHRSADPAILSTIHHHHPRFLDEKVTWLPKRLTGDQIAAAPFDEDDARLTLARAYSFLDWSALVDHVDAVTDPGSPVHRFESAAETVITGDLDSLDRLLHLDPALIAARSARRTCHDPRVHAATLLHYLAANGVEGYRQLSPPNAVAVANRLLRAGAAVDALAGMYGGRHPTLAMLVSSSPPAKAGVQGAVAEALLDAGAAIDGVGEGNWTSPIRTALVFGFIDTAQMLARRGATVDLVAAAGLGREDSVRRLWPAADPLARHRAFALAVQLDRLTVVGFMLDQGADPSRYNPEGFHAHSTPLHQAALAGHRAMAELLLAKGARIDLADRLYQGTPLDWAVYGNQPETAALLRS